jgi:hypothetical protein
MMAEKDKKAFTGGVDKAQAEFNKALASAKTVLADAKKQGNKEVATVARGLINQLNTVAKPALDILQKTQNPNAAYTGNVTPINQALGGGAPGSGPSGVILNSGGTGAYSLGEIKSYMDANNGAFPPDLNTIASGISAADLGNLQNQYNTGKGLGGSDKGLKTNADLIDSEKQERRQSIYDTVASELTRLGLSSLISPLRTLFESGISEGESLRLALSQTPEYQTRFSANAKRIAAGLSALSPAEYIQLEDQYQNVMRNYGLPSSYYTKDSTGKQVGFDELLGGDVSATELEERLIAGQERVLKSNPEVLQAIKDFYGDSITNGNILAYALDPKNALKDIQRKVAAAEIGGAALAQKLATSAAGAEELAGLGVTKSQAQQGFIDVAQMAPRGSVLSEIYNQTPYNQATATAEVFGTAGAADAAQKRRKLTALEEATFSGQSGLAQGALARNGGGGAF